MLQLLLGPLQARGLAIEGLLAELGVAAEQAVDLEARVPLQALLGLWALAAQRLADDNLGIHIAQMPPAGIVSVIQLAVRNSRNLGECWRRAVRFAHLAVDGPGPRIDEEGDAVYLRFRPALGQDAVPRHPTEFALASYVVSGRMLTQAPLLPRAVRFRHSRPRDASAHHSLFGIPASFDHAASEIEFDRAVLELPIKHNDPVIAGVMERYAEEWLSRLSPRTSLLDQVRHHVYSELGSGVPSASLIAKRMHMSERSFSRRLHEEGASYPKIVEDVRKELAAVYLRNRTLKLAEVSFLLGFSDLSAFYRAFRRWTGQTPVQARESGSAAGRTKPS